jgi:hypothetical protein
MTSAEAVRSYKALAEVERAFLHIRPIHHRLRAELEQQVKGDYAALRDFAGAQQVLRTIGQLSRVDPTAHTADQCSAHGGSVITGRCLVINPPH